VRQKANGPHEEFVILRDREAPVELKVEAGGSFVERGYDLCGGHGLTLALFSHPIPDARERPPIAVKTVILTSRQNG
jgi:hypothetical protein